MSGGYLVGENNPNILSSQASASAHHNHHHHHHFNQPQHSSREISSGGNNRKSPVGSVIQPVYDFKSAAGYSSGGKGLAVASQSSSRKKMAYSKSVENLEGGKICKLVISKQIDQYIFLQRY